MKYTAAIIATVAAVFSASVATAAPAGTPATCVEANRYGRLTVEPTTVKQGQVSAICPLPQADTVADFLLSFPHRQQLTVNYLQPCGNYAGIKPSRINFSIGQPSSGYQEVFVATEAVKDYRNATFHLTVPYFYITSKTFPNGEALVSQIEYEGEAPGGKESKYFYQFVTPLKVTQVGS